MKKYIIKKRVHLSFEFDNNKEDNNTLNTMNVGVGSFFENFGGGYAEFDIIYDSREEPVDYLFVNINQYFEKLIFTSRDNIIGSTIREIFPYSKSFWLNDFHEIVKQQKKLEFEKYSVELDKHFRLVGYVREKRLYIALFDITVVKNNERKLNHLNHIFQSIRSVNRLITKESDKTYLLENVCNILVENKAYTNIWVGLFLPDNKIKFYSSGFNEDLTQYLDNLENYSDFSCAGNIDELKDINIILDPGVDYPECTIFKNMYDKSVLQARLEFDNQIFGIIGVAIPRKYVNDQDELSLFAEITNDISYALRTIEIERLHREEEQRAIAYAQEIKNHNEILQNINIELNTAKEKAIESDKLKSIFLANMSHELRTPLNAILGFSDLLKRRLVDDDKRDEFVDLIITSGERLLRIINDMLNFTLIEANQLKIVNQTFSLNLMLNDVYSKYINLVENKGLHLIVSKDLPDSNCFIFADDKKICQVFYNLLDNSIKYTERGVIEFGYTCKTKDELLFYVKDTGIGIDKKNFNLIFEKFRQLDEGSSRRYGGTGMGLTTSKKFIELMHGKIWVDSEINKGSIIYFSIPLEKEIEGVVERFTKGSNQDIVLDGNKKILIVEDDYASYRYLEELLSEYNCVIIHSEDGEKAVEICRDNDDIKLVLMDIQLPKMDGYTATKKIKELRGDLPVIAQSAYTYQTNKEESINAGCDDYLAKPVDKEMISSIIQKHLVKKN